MKQDLHEKRNLALRLAGYSASAGALLALNPLVHGQVVYSGIKNIQMSMPSDYAEIDLDSNLIPDFAIRMAGSSGSSSFTYYSHIYNVWYASGYAAMYNARTDGYQNSWITRMTTITSYYISTSGTYTYFYYYPILAGLDAGVTVDSAQSMWSNLTYPYYPGALGVGYLYSITGPSYSGFYSYGYGDFFGRERYIGVRFYIGTDQHYGWIRASLGDYIDPVTIIDWAYEDTPGEGIITGEGDDIGPVALFDAGITVTPEKTIVVELTFNERAYGFNQADIDVINGTITYFEIEIPGLSYLMEVTADGPGEVMVGLPAASVNDLAGNMNAESSTSWIYNHVDALNSIADAQVKIYPNPVSNDLHIDLPAEANIKIITLSGKVVFAKENVTQETINVDGIDPGVYIVQILNSEGVQQHKIVIQ